ncbi:glyoxalase superfamily protein [Primorskyibacter sp. S187A]|uniref:glyoxalase superfamily protein n=1 Tax=Primorskyibacter sp. S187A TaxID=3415130 RepID=UPI003C7DD4AC
MSRELPSVAEVKSEAKRLRAALAEQRQQISHAQALERIAKHHGFRDWNALCAKQINVWPRNLQIGGRVTGRYMSQPFRATVRKSEQIRPGRLRLVLALDEAVDVVRFDSFSNLRKQVRVEIGPAGHSKERTSDGVPHAEIDL